MAVKEEGLVIASFGQHALVRLSAEVQIPCTQKGKKNAVVTGDWVQVEVDGEQGQIVTILPRRNLFYRSDLFKQKSFAANIDQIFYVVACEPYFDVDLLGRAAIAAESAHINFVIILNKSDLTPLLPLARERLAQYVLWYPLVQTTTQITALSLQQQFSTLLEGQTTLLLGQSGMGKSSLLNLLILEAKRKTREISQKLATGRHTSTNTHWFAYDDGHHQGALIDSPGFQVFGLAHLTMREILHAMPDMRPLLQEPCRFYNCTHAHEPGCIVQQALAQGRISPERYGLYRQLLSEAERAVLD